jgi:indolepyruvate ferredoxin oxidoreductase
LDDELESESLREEKLREEIKQKLGERILLSFLKKISFEAFGKSVYASAMILGVAFQDGRIPFSAENLKKAFQNTLPKNEFDNNWEAFRLGRKIALEGDDPILKALGSLREQDNGDEMFLKSLKEGLLPWENKKKILARFHKMVSGLEDFFPEIKPSYLSQYAHDLFVFDRGKKGTEFLKDAQQIKELYSNEEERFIALRTLVRTYWIKDEIYVSSLMSTPHQNELNKQTYLKLGTGFNVIHINRPRFDLFGKTFEFDINPKDWMLKIMRHMRVIRKILPGWHKKEKQMAEFLRTQILQVIPSLPQQERRKNLKNCENVKGFREVRYQKFEDIFEGQKG